MRKRSSGRAGAWCVCGEEGEGSSTIGNPRLNGPLAERGNVVQRDALEADAEHGQREPGGCFIQKEGKAGGGRWLLPSRRLPNVLEQLAARGGASALGNVVHEEAVPPRLQLFQLVAFQRDGFPGPCSTFAGGVVVAREVVSVAVVGVVLVVVVARVHVAHVAGAGAKDEDEDQDQDEDEERELGTRR